MNELYVNFPPGRVLKVPKQMFFNRTEAKKFSEPDEVVITLEQAIYIVCQNILEEALAC